MDQVQRPDGQKSLARVWAGWVSRLVSADDSVQLIIYETKNWDLEGLWLAGPEVNKAVIEEC